MKSAETGTVMRCDSAGDGRLPFGRHDEHHEARAAGAQQLAAQGAGAPGVVIDAIDGRRAGAVGQAPLQRPAFMQELAEIAQPAGMEQVDALSTISRMRLRCWALASRLLISFLANSDERRLLPV